MRIAQQKLPIPPLHIQGEADKRIDRHKQLPQILVIFEDEANRSIRVFRWIKHWLFAL